MSMAGAFEEWDSLVHGDMIWCRRGGQAVCSSKVSWRGGEEQEYVIKEGNPGGAPWVLDLPECARKLVKNDRLEAASVVELLDSALAIERRLTGKVKLEQSGRLADERSKLARVHDQAFELIGKHRTASEQERYSLNHKLYALKDRRDELLEQLAGRKQGEEEQA